jgi:hypothetical protein
LRGVVVLVGGELGGEGEEGVKGGGGDRCFVGCFVGMKFYAGGFFFGVFQIRELSS